MFHSEEAQCVGKPESGALKVMAFGEQSGLGISYGGVPCGLAGGIVKSPLFEGRVHSTQWV